MEALEEETDESLMVRIQSGDHRAFSVLVHRYTHMFFAAAYRMTADREETEDIVQEAFLKIWKNPQSWNADKGVKFTTWFYKVVVNLSIDKIRRKGRFSAAEFLDQWPDQRSGQQGEMEKKQRQANLEEAIDRLPVKQKTALNLCFYEDLSNREAAEIMGIGIKALESLLMRAKAGIKDYLVRKGKLV
jgi:RNA polymerase sigma-70 factor (ECF subfamily)